MFLNRGLVKLLMGFFKKMFKKDSSGIPPAPDFPPKEENIDNSVPPAPDPFSNEEIPAPNIDAPPAQEVPQQSAPTEETMPKQQAEDNTEDTDQLPPEPKDQVAQERSEEQPEEDLPPEVDDPLPTTPENPKQAAEEQEDDYEYEPERITEGPIFCKVHVYREILEEIDHSLNKCKGCTDIAKRTNELRIEDDKELDKWKNILLDAYRKIHYIDKIIFEGEKR